jgi:hypothetical protein
MRKVVGNVAFEPSHETTDWRPFGATADNARENGQWAIKENHAHCRPAARPWRAACHGKRVLIDNRISLKELLCCSVTIN